MATRRGDCESMAERSPDRAERRRHRRSPTRATARMTSEHGEQTVFIENLSEQGLGLVEVEEIEIGDEVIIAFDDGRRVGGRTIWRDGARGGVETFDSTDESGSDASSTS